MGKKLFVQEKPNLPRRLFWDFWYDDIEWHEEYLTVKPSTLYATI